MTRHTNPHAARDQVLCAFHEAYDSPTAEQILEWTRRYPEFADDIRAHAAIARDWAARKSLPAEKPDDLMVARGHSRVLNALYNAAIAAAESEPEPCESFQQLLAARGTDLPQLARQLDIGRSALADMVNGGMLAPVGKRLIDAITTALRITGQQFDAALKLALNAPRVGHAKAESMPKVIPRSYEDIIRNSNMSPERVAYWLSEN